MRIVQLPLADTARSGVANPRTTQPLQIAEAIEGFLIAKAAEGFSPHTRIDYGHTLRLLTEYLANPPLAAITADDLRNFLAWLRSDYQPVRKNGNTAPLSAHTLSNIWCGLRSFFHWCAQEGLLKQRPDEALRKPEYRLPEITPFTQEEIMRLLEAAEFSREVKTDHRKSFRMRRATADRDKALLLLLLDTGLRAGEVGRLCISDVNLETGEVFVTAFGSGRKTKSRIVYLGRSTRRVLWRYLHRRPQADPADPLFISMRGGQAMDPNSIRIIISRMGYRSGVAHTYPHRFRHTFAIEYLRNGGDVFTLQRLLGHSTLDMVRHYVALAEADAANSHRRASPVDKWRL